MLVREITPEERRRTTELFGIAFELPVGKEDPREPLPENIHLWAAFQEEEMASCMTLVSHPIRFDGHVCRMTGIGGVSTLPQYRRQGGIRSIFSAILPHMYQTGVDFSYLYPFSTAYYRQFGYETCVQKLQVTMKLANLRVPAGEGHFCLSEQRHPMAEQIRSLDRLWERKFNMMVQHQEPFYDWVTKANPAVDQEFTYVFFDAADRPKAYLTYHMEHQSTGRSLICTRFCFADREGFNGLMRFFQSVSADHDYAQFQLPASSGMQHLIPEWALGNPTFTLIPWGMVRVINAESVLKKAKYQGSGCLTIALRDSMIPENNDTFTIRFEKGTAVSVERNIREADIFLDINTFSGLILGTSDFQEAAQWMEGIEIQNPGACFGQVFYRKQMMITDFF